MNFEQVEARVGVREYTVAREGPGTREGKDRRSNVSEEEAGCPGGIEEKRNQQTAKSKQVRAKNLWHNERERVRIITI